MRLLLDTHTFLWAITGDKRLSRTAHALLSSFESEVFVSAASAWEISTKYRLGKLPETHSLMPGIVGIVEQVGFHELPISLDHAQRAGSLAGTHNDPFDRMLIAQAQAENLTLVSNERLFDSFGIRRVW